MRAKTLRRILQVLLLLPLTGLFIEWAQGPKYAQRVYLGWAILLALIILLIGPWWIERKTQPDALLSKPRQPEMSFLIYGLLVCTAMPVILIYTVVWAGLSLGMGALLVVDGQILRGLLTVSIPLLGVVGLYSLWALARWYVREPRSNPARREFLLHGAGLCMGLVAVVCMWTAGDIWNWGDLVFAYVLLGSLPPVVVTVFFVLLMVFNRLWPRRPLKHKIA
jgi:hypothetical protein